METEAQEMEATGLAGVVLRAWKRRGAQRQERDLKVVETVALGGRARLHVVVCGGQRFLVGAGADVVQCIVPVGGDAEAIDLVSE